MKNTFRNWTRRSGGFVTSFYPREYLPVLEEAGLESIVLDPDSILEDEIEVTRIGAGGRSYVYDIDDTGIAVKKHFPTFYYINEWINRRNSTSTVLANLGVNLDFEKALRKDRDYTTPLYLGHLILKYGDRETWNYTLMTELNILDKNDLSATERKRFKCLCKVAQWHCLEALARENLPTTGIRWTEAKGYYNVLPVYEDANVKAAVIDLESTNAHYPIANYESPRQRWKDPWIGNI